MQDARNSEPVYRRLQQHLDHMPVGFPEAESGADLRILKRLFTPADAELALALSAFPESLAVIHRRLGTAARSASALSREDLENALDSMADRGLIERHTTKHGPRYGKSMFIVGIYERQLNRLTPELERDILEYLDEAFPQAFYRRGAAQLRTVPVNKSVPIEHDVARYDDILTFVSKSPGPFAVMDCVCRQGHSLVGKPCLQTKGRENCLTFGEAAQMMSERGDARLVSREEMIAKLDEAASEGLVLQPQNTQDPLFVCCCCGCCCGVLTTAKKLPRPADFFRTNYYAEVNAPLCLACGNCVARCQMDAIKLDEAAAFVDLARCIGCGLCVTTCQTEAMSLLPRADSHRPPRDTSALYAQIYRKRFGTAALVKAAAANLLGRQV